MVRKESKNETFYIISLCNVLELGRWIFFPMHMSQKCLVTSKVSFFARKASRGTPKERVVFGK